MPKSIDDLPTIVVGALFRLQQFCWAAHDEDNPPFLPNNERRLREIAKLTDREWQRWKGVILDCLEVDEPTMLLYIPDLFAQWTRAHVLPHRSRTHTAVALRENPEADRVWEQVRDVYPHRAGGQGWADAEKHYRLHVRRGVKPTDILEGVQRYRAYIEATARVGTEYVKQAATFFGRGMHWQEQWELPNHVPLPGRPSPARQQFEAISQGLGHGRIPR